jgi:hypothetical protein
MFLKSRLPAEVLTLLSVRRLSFSPGHPRCGHLKQVTLRGAQQDLYTTFRASPQVRLLLGPSRLQYSSTTCKRKSRLPSPALPRCVQLNPRPARLTCRSSRLPTRCQCLHLRSARTPPSALLPVLRDMQLARLRVKGAREARQRATPYRPGNSLLAPGTLRKASALVMV